MKIRKSKNGAIKMTAQSKRDSLNLLKFMAGDDPEFAELIAKKEKECAEFENVDKDVS